MNKFKTLTWATSVFCLAPCYADDVVNSAYLLPNGEPVSYKSDCGPESTLTSKNFLVAAILLFGFFSNANDSVFGNENHQSMDYKNRYVPGKNNTERWSIVSRNLEMLANANREQVRKIFGNSCANQPNSDVWSFKITDNEHEANTSINSGEKFHILQLRFSSEVVQKVEICTVEWEVNKTLSH